MERTNKWFHLLLILSGIFIIGFIIILICLGYPEKISHQFYIVLSYCKQVCFFGFLFCITLCGIVKSILNDLEWELASILCNIEEIKKQLGDDNKCQN
ncbi:hypothetical protein RBG61_13805 [Paludicola sp. MB14-C6]|uniref:hypothetical protein n=1 Tax=Paludihabitans sp. MB14-C6 TaxID=3070656 RepID=UPI0027DC189B|nr:hypothetical protein [Paludicola sp. MB14-C6]WMJ23045.1 hypothetical protein RBG61_13805 [Paludicola sp. MB14-C6]